MASPDASDYFPALDKCLDGSAQLISWHQVYLLLRDGLENEENGPAHRFVNDAKAQNILKRTREPFPRQTAQSKALFERLTSAINAPPSTNGKYDIKQVKDDALWLSNTATVDEVSALRVVILELQHRPEDLIIDDIKSVEDAGLGRSFQQPALLRSVLGASQNAGFHQSVLRVDSQNTKSRQVRLLALLLTERVYAAKIRQLAGFAASVKSGFSGPAWLRQIGDSLEESWFEGSGNVHSFSVEILAALEVLVHRLQNGCSWPCDESQIAQLASLWVDSSAAELALDLELLLHLLQARTTLLPSKLVSGWFEVMEKTSFFEVFEMINPETKESHVNVIQSLVSLISVAILQPSVAVAAIDDFAAEANASASSDAQSYLKETACVDLITNVLLNAAGAGGGRKLVLAGPAMFAWVVIMQTVRSYATQSIDARESRQAEKALDQQPHDSDSDGFEILSRIRSEETRRSSFGSESEPPATLIETIADAVQRNMPNDDPIHFFAECAVGLSSGLRAFETIARLSTDFCVPYGHDFGGQVGLELRGLLLQLLSTSLIWIPYSPEILESILAVLSGGLTNAELQMQCDQFPKIHPVSLFLGDERLKTQILEQAFVRFPYESAPLFALAQCLAHASLDAPDRPVSSILESLQHRSTLTTFLIEGLADWDLADSDGVRLLSALDVFTAEQWQSGYEDGYEHNALLQLFHGRPQAITPFVIPVGSTGRVLKIGAANEGKVVMWNFNHSALSYIGFKLQRDARAWISGGALSADALNDPVSLITALLQAANEEQAVQILGECSDSLYDSVDIIEVILELCESLLYRPQAADGVSALLVTCLGFVRTTLRFLPGRIWPFLGRSGLLGLNKSESRLHVVVATSEVPSGLFPFLLEAVHLFEGLVDDALRRSVERRAAAKAITRFEVAQANTLSAGVTETKMSHILTQFHALMTDIYESCRSWRFAFPGQRVTILSKLSNVMARSIEYAYDIDDNHDDATKLVGFIASSAAYVTDVFLASSSNNSACHALVETILEGTDSAADPLATYDRCQVVKQTKAVLSLAQRLVLLRHARNQKPATLEESLFKAVPQLIKIYNTHTSYRTPTVSLLDSLVLTAGRSDSPPSLLSHVGTETARHFLQVLYKLDRPCPDKALNPAIWRFLTSVVTKKQQWFSIFLLTGSTPRDTLRSSRSGPDETSNEGSMLGLALERISELGKLDLREAETLVGFVAQAADFWPRVCSRIRNRKSTMDGLIQYLRGFDPSDRSQRSDSIQRPLRTQIASHILDIMALLVNSDAETGEKSFAHMLIGSLTNFMHSKDSQYGAVSNPDYNASLQDRLSRNFGSHFLNCSLSSLKRTLVPKSVLGNSFFYDLDVSDTILSYDPAWIGTRGKGFRTETMLANENMSLVEATINMFHSWKSLIVEIAETLRDDKKVALDIAQVVLSCLKANRDSHLPETIFRRLAQARADLAFTLLQQVIRHMKADELSQQILSTVWELLKEPADDLGGALTGDDGQYCRTCLRILSVALRPHCQEMPLDARRSAFSLNMKKPIAIDILLLEILRTVVAKGFRSLVSALHDDASKVQPGDMALLLAIFRIILSVPDMVKHDADLLNIFSEEKTATYASALFSWSDKLLVEGDPIYGEISISFLYELSTMPLLAEVIVTNGCLGQILGSNLARVYQKGVGPFDPPVRVYNIWARGILPLVVSVLSALGPLIAADIATFVNRFGGQLERVDTQFNTKDPKNPYNGLVTLAIAGEIQSLALLAKILETYKDAGPSVGVVSANIQDLAWDKTRVIQDVEDLLSRRASLRELIVPRDAKEEAWMKSKPLSAGNTGNVGGGAGAGAGAGAENRLEEEVVIVLTSALEILNANDS